MTVISRTFAFVLISVIVGSVVSKKLRRSHQQSLRADVSEGESVESLRPPGSYCKGTHFKVLRIAFTSKFSLGQTTQKPFKTAMTCPKIDLHTRKPGMKPNYWMMEPKQENWEAKWAWSKRKFLRHATILSTDFAGERLFWGGLPTELAIRVTTFRALHNNGLPPTAAENRDQKQLDPLDNTVMGNHVYRPGNWMTGMARRQWLLLAPVQAVVAAGGGTTAVAAAVINSVSNYFWTMPFSEMLFHGSHDAGCIDTKNFLDVAAGDRWATAALQWPLLAAAPRNVNCRRAINTNAGLLKTLKGTKAGMGLGAVGGLLFGGPAGAVSGFAAGAVLSKEPQGWCIHNIGREAASTQTKTITQQLESGTRWFDIRTSTTQYVGLPTANMPPNGDDNYRLFHPFGLNSKGGHFYGLAMQVFVDINQFLAAGNREHEVVFIKLKPYGKNKVNMRIWLLAVYAALTNNGVHVVGHSDFNPVRNVFDLSLHDLHGRYRAANLGARAGYAVVMIPKKDYKKYVLDEDENIIPNLNWIWNEKEQEFGTGTGKVEKCTTSKIHKTQEGKSEEFMGSMDREARAADGDLAEDCGAAQRRRLFPDLAEGCTGGDGEHMIRTTNWVAHETDCYLSTNVMNMCPLR